MACLPCPRHTSSWIGHSFSVWELRHRTNRRRRSQWVLQKVFRGESAIRRVSQNGRSGRRPTVVVDNILMLSAAGFDLSRSSALASPIRQGGRTSGNSWGPEVQDAPGQLAGYATRLATGRTPQIRGDDAGFRSCWRDGALDDLDSS